MQDHEYEEVPVFAYQAITDKGEECAHASLDVAGGICTDDESHECEGFVVLSVVVHDEDTDETQHFDLSFNTAEAELLAGRLRSVVDLA
jgi:hypothetical protein